MVHSKLQNILLKFQTSTFKSQTSLLRGGKFQFVNFQNEELVILVIEIRSLFEVWNLLFEI